VSTATLARFFDVPWTERPGGYRAAVQLSAARRVLELHAGTIQVQTSERGGCRILMTLPAPVASR
jgi:K+-sensing histidine kinase KdpD